MMRSNQPVETNAHTGWPADVTGPMMMLLQQCSGRFQRVAQFQR